MQKVLKGIDTPEVNYPKGTVIFVEGQESGVFFVLKKGQVGIYRNYEKPDQFQLAVIEEGRVFGEISGFDGRPRSATAVALTDVVIRKVSASALRGQMKQCPSWFQSIILELVARLRNTDDLLVKHGLGESNSISSMQETAAKEET